MLCILTLVASLLLSSWNVSVRAAPLPGPDTCLKPYVWREAKPSDHVCVSVGARTAVKAQNAAAAVNRSPMGGAFGPDTCKSGFVWRDAFAGDHVCVLPAVRCVPGSSKENCQVFASAADTRSFHSLSMRQQ